MNTARILAAAVVATFAAASWAQNSAPGMGCAGGYARGSADCPALGAGPAGPRGGNGAAAMQERLKAADTNADGFISLEEAQAALPGLAAHFAAIDTDGDGRISLAEIEAAHQARHARGHRGQGWKKWDANGDGVLTREEVANAPRLSQDFDAIDTDRSGTLSAEELRAAHQRHAGRGIPGKPAGL